MADSIIYVLLFELCFSLFEPDLDLRLRIAGSLSRGLPVLRSDIASEGISVFRSEMLPLIARRRRDFLKLMMSAVCCNKFLALWDLVSSVFEVSVWTEAFEPGTIDITMGTMSLLSTPVTNIISNLTGAYMWRDRFGFFQSKSRQSLS